MWPRHVFSPYAMLRPFPFFYDSKWWKTIRVVLLGTRVKERFKLWHAQAFSRTGRAETVVRRFDGAGMK